jgi:hypothetical protein
MAERWWIPILAAVVGIVGGVGGAYVGGSVANKGQEEQFDNQREADVQDLLIDTYTNYLQTTSRLWVARQNRFSNAEQLESEALAAESQVEFDTPELEDVARGLLDAAREPASEEVYLSARKEFIQVAEDRVGPVG